MEKESKANIGLDAQDTLIMEAISHANTMSNQAIAKVKQEIEPNLVLIHRKIATLCRQCSTKHKELDAISQCCAPYNYIQDVLSTNMAQAMNGEHNLFKSCIDNATDAFRSTKNTQKLNSSISVCVEEFQAAMPKKIKSCVSGSLSQLV
jgi:hypothetical protein